jgi:hypothetical protein
LSVFQAFFALLTHSATSAAFAFGACSVVPSPPAHHEIRSPQTALVLGLCRPSATLGCTCVRAALHQVEKVHVVAVQASLMAFFTGWGS